MIVDLSNICKIFLTTMNFSNVIASWVNKPPREICLQVISSQLGTITIPSDILHRLLKVQLMLLYFINSVSVQLVYLERLSLPLILFLCRKEFSVIIEKLHIMPKCISFNPVQVARYCEIQFVNTILSICQYLKITRVSVPRNDNEKWA